MLRTAALLASPRNEVSGSKFPPVLGCLKVQHYSMNGSGEGIGGRENSKDKGLVVGPGSVCGIRVSWRPKLSLFLLSSFCRRASKLSCGPSSSKPDTAAARGSECRYYKRRASSQDPSVLAQQTSDVWAGTLVNLSRVCVVCVCV